MTNVAGKIFNIQANGNLIEMKQTGFSTELDFQKLLADYPGLLGGDQLNPTHPRQWLLVRREMGVADQPLGSDRWSLDHLFLDQDGIPTLVEVKRSSDPRLRREVVGQILDYAANGLLHWTCERIQNEFAMTCESQKKDPLDCLENFLEDNSVDIDNYWKSVEENLKLGKIRILIVADDIPLELQAVVEFLNRQLDPAEFFAIEIRQFEGQGIRTLVPRIIGKPKAPPEPEGYDRTRIKVTMDGVESESEARRRAVLRVVRALAMAKRTAEEINAAIPWRTVLCKVPDAPNDASIVERLAMATKKKNPSSIWFTKENELVPFGDGLYAVEKQWGKRTTEALDIWIKSFGLNASYKVNE